MWAGGCCQVVRTCKAEDEKNKGLRHFSSENAWQPTNLVKCRKSQITSHMLFFPQYHSLIDCRGHDSLKRCLFGNGTSVGPPQYVISSCCNSTSHGGQRERAALSESDSGGELDQIYVSTSSVRIYTYTEIDPPPARPWIGPPVLPTRWWRNGERGQCSAAGWVACGRGEGEQAR